MSGGEGKFRPVPSPETLPFWTACAGGRLLIQQCLDCGARQFYPRAHCATCLGTSLEWLETSGQGTVRSFTVVHVPVSGAWADDVPYVVALIELAEGPTMMSNIVGCSPEDVTMGMAVEVVFEDRGEGIVLPQFRPRDGNHDA